MGTTEGLPSLLRTIELIFGAPPMNRYDATAIPMFDAFTTEVDLAPYDARPRQIPDSANLAGLPGAEECARMDFSVPDQAPGLPRILWRYFRGEEPPWALDGDSNPLPVLFDEEEAEEEREKFELWEEMYRARTEGRAVAVPAR